MELSVPGILLGILFGTLGFLPLFFASRSVTPAAKPNVVALAIACVGFPLLFMLVAVLVCYKVAPGALLCFGSAMAGALLVWTLCYTCGYFIKRR